MPINAEKIRELELEGAMLGVEAEKTMRQQDSETRQGIAKQFVRYYFIILILIIIGVPIYNFLMYQVADDPALLISIKDAILTYSAVVGSTFGLVVAYYFQSTKEN